ncbi:putative ATP-dependent RNA helicase [Gracilariopsis chorda]|uniref:RNA helicase n=1 Tax=Gracilariopsis chorda TaxID=448386 RepID=A0A2V3J1V0_9FLOR|nr:putative ATP-dependent RNA helicase [Gracilariopsis chorda]|eukprot:PXF48406.1 putative ATP-dependent RNA helicase [Gracilariopsis chorda]
MLEKRGGETAPQKTSVKKRRKFFVHVDRKPQVQAARLELPVCMHEQEIIDAVHHNDVVLVSGATGTGKTTQVPQFLVEDGFGDAASPEYKGMIAVTQPRRVAAVTCARRVAYEMNTRLGSLVGYHVRHDAKFGEETKIKFVTDGVLLREVEDDVLLNKYSAIVIDEVHERSMNTDLLLAFLSRTTVLRRKQENSVGRLKVIVMSATLDVQGVFAGDGALFPNPPMVKVPSRQYPVTIHFARRTAEDYVDESFRKVSQIHRRLPQGGVLVFLSGRQEVEEVCKRLREEFGNRKIDIRDSEGQKTGIEVIPFYAMLADHLQRRVFDTFGEDIRKVVVATNIAETSVTVPGISYVVDSGRVKEKVYRKAGGGLLSAYEVKWVSQASAEQRAGRGGRTGAGHCYRLYSSAVYEQQFEEFRAPEIVRVPADSIVLRLRAMGIRHVTKFPFPTRPNVDELVAAEKVLLQLGALHSDQDGQNGQQCLLGVTKVGRELARIPLPPRFGRMLLAAWEDGDAFPYACRLAGVLTVGTVLERGEKEALHKVFYKERGELLREMGAVCAAEHSGRQDGRLDVRSITSFCGTFGLIGRSVVEAIRVSEQLEELFGWAPSALEPAEDRTERVLVRCFLKAFADQVGRRMRRDEAAELGVAPKRLRRAFVLRGGDGAFVEGKHVVDESAQFVVYWQLLEREAKVKGGGGGGAGRAEIRDDYDEMESDCEERGGGATRAAGAKEKFLRGVCAIEKEWLVEDARQLCELREVGGGRLGQRGGKRMVEAGVTYGGWPLGRVRVTPS